jgi:hypothetical protein
MSEHVNAIKEYYWYLNNLEISPYESMNMLDVRDYLHDNFHKLTIDEQSLVEHLDHILHLNASTMHDHLSQVYNFDNSAEVPPDKWWWHLHSYKQLSAGIEALENFASFKQLIVV